MKKILTASLVFVSCGNNDEVAMIASIASSQNNMKAEKDKADQLVSEYERLNAENEYYGSDLHKKACDIRRKQNRK